MRARRTKTPALVRLALATLAPGAFAGCGTVTGTARVGLEPYRGVRTSVTRCDWALDPVSGIFWLCDVPVSACVDTALLPVSVPCALVRESDGVAPTTSRAPCGSRCRKSGIKKPRRAVLG